MSAIHLQFYLFIALSETSGNSLQSY